MIWDETKRLTNLEKHHLDFADAGLSYPTVIDWSLKVSRMKKSGDRLLHMSLRY